MRIYSSDNSSTHIVALGSNVDLSSATNVVLSFFHIAQTEGTYDRCYVQVSEDGGANYVDLPSATYTGSSDYGTRGYFDEYSYTSSPDWQDNGSPVAPCNTWWVEETFNLNNYIGNNDVRIRFKYTTDGSST